MVTLINLSGLTVLLGRHFRLEKRYRRPIEIELGGDALFSFWGLIGQNLLVWRSLNLHMRSSVNWLRGRNLTIRVDVLSFFSADAGFFKCPLFRVALVHDHSVWIGSCGDNHGSIGATSHDSSIMHNILWEILSVKFKNSYG